jgi:hypothetical protein
MKVDISNIEINPISFSYVVVWKRLLNNIPPYDSEFCKNLFGKPEETVFGFNQQGLSISTKQTITPNPEKNAQVVI